MKEILSFLLDIEANNNREWFNENRKRHTKAHDFFLHVTGVLINEIRSFDKEIPFLESQKCTVRIYRDLRFSLDKRPYKNYFGAFIAYQGRNAGNPGYYIHIQPGQSFVSGGIYKPSPQNLKAIRTEIFHYADELIDIINESKFELNFELIDDEKLKTAPKGFPSEFEHINLLRYKSFTPVKYISDEELLSAEIIESIVKDFKLLKPINQYLYNAIKQNQ